MSVLVWAMVATAIRHFTALIPKLTVPVR